MNPPGVKEQRFELEPHLVHHAMKFRKTLENPTDHGLGNIVGVQGFKVGGIPSWIQDPEYYVCSCGGTMRFICQLPGDHGFPKTAQVVLQR
jgi:hypothetical protein